MVLHTLLLYSGHQCMHCTALCMQYNVKLCCLFSSWFAIEANDNDCVYMQEHNRVMNASNEDWFHVNRSIRSASPKGSSQDWISEADRIAGHEPVLVGDLPACVLDVLECNISLWLNPIRSDLVRPCNRSHWLANDMTRSQRRTGTLWVLWDRKRRHKCNS